MSTSNFTKAYETAVKENSTIYMPVLLSLVDNEMIDNTGGYGDGLLDFRGLFKVVISDCAFDRNGENMVEIVNNFTNGTYNFIP